MVGLVLTSQLHNAHQWYWLKINAELLSDRWLDSKGVNESVDIIGETQIDKIARAAVCKPQEVSVFFSYLFITQRIFRRFLLQWHIYFSFQCILCTATRVCSCEGWKKKNIVDILDFKLIRLIVISVHTAVSCVYAIAMRTEGDGLTNAEWNSVLFFLVFVSQWNLISLMAAVGKSTCN